MQTSEQSRQRKALGQLTRLYNVLQNSALYLSHIVVFLLLGDCMASEFSGLMFQITVPSS